MSRRVLALAVFLLMSGVAGARLSARGNPTTLLPSVGGKKTCDVSHGLAGWRIDQQKLWSLERTLHPSRGTAPQAVVISFFATWCEPCRNGLPILQRVAETDTGASAAFVLVAVPEYDVRIDEYLAGLGVTLPAVSDEQKTIWKRWNGADTGSLPLTVVLNRSQQIVAAFGAEGDDYESQLMAAINGANDACEAPAQ